MVVMVRKLRRSECRRNPKIAVAQQRIKALRHDTDNGSRQAVYANRLADDGWISMKTGAPEPFADNNNRRVTRLVLINGEDTSGYGLHAKCRKVIEGCNFSIHPFGNTLRFQIKTRIVRAADLRIRAALLFDVVEIANGDIPSRALPLFLQKHHARGIFDGQRPQKDSIDDAENCRGCANAEGQRKHGDNREPGTLAQNALSVPKILEEFIEEADAPCFAPFLLDALDPAELHACPAHRFLS